MPASRTASLQTLGCRLNQAETEMIGKSLRERGYTLVGEDESADLYVINTCTVTAQSDAKNRQAIRSVHRRNPAATIAVIGCYAQMAPEQLQQIEGVKLIVGNADKLNLAHYLDQAETQAGPLVVTPKISREPFQIPVWGWEQQQTTRAYLKIQDGCNFMCTFCIIPFARGRARGRAFANLLEEAQTLITNGVKEIVLTGVNIGTYQVEGRGVTEVVDALHELPGLERIRISSIEPTTVEPGLLERMADQAHKLVPFLHLPLQAGADEVLQRMKRRYHASDYRREIEAAYARIPDLCLGTDVMVGFPGESDADFEATFRLLESLPLAYFHVFPFSEREGTPAFKMPDPVEAAEKQRRGAVLRQLSQHKRREFYMKFAGSVRAVLFESLNSKGEANGYTDNYIKVCLRQASRHDLKNQILPVRLEEPQEEVMLGSLVSR